MSSCFESCKRYKSTKKAHLNTGVKICFSTQENVNRILFFEKKKKKVLRFEPIGYLLVVVLEVCIKPIQFRQPVKSDNNYDSMIHILMMVGCDFPVL